MPVPTKSGSASLASGPGSIGKYVLGKTIGEGTFGKVKLGTHILTGETVAVKILERARVKEIADVERVAREIHILKRVPHPNIIRIYEIIETPDQLLLIMEYCGGGELFDHIAGCGRVPEGEACRFLQQILSGVEHVHKMNIVHRDLKPENLLLDKDMNLKIVDFGLSNTYRDGQLLKTACGSPCYAPPEMIAGHWYVPSRCDVWSCGVTLFALVCGHLPFEDSNTSALYRKILNAEYTVPSFVSDSVRDLISLMLTVDPEKRATIADIRQHEWYCQIPEARAPGDGDELEKHFDEHVLDELVSLGCSRECAVESLKNSLVPNTVSATYYLLLERNRRKSDSSEHELCKLAAVDADGHDSEAGGAREMVLSGSAADGADNGNQSSSSRRRIQRSRKKDNAGSLVTVEVVVAVCNSENEGLAGTNSNAGYRRNRNRRRNRGGKKQSGGQRWVPVCVGEAKNEQAT